MAAYTVSSPSHRPRDASIADRGKHDARVLCLGNDLLADDSLGALVAQQLRQLGWPGVEIAYSAATGFDLLDYLLDTPLLIVVDTVVTGACAPGTISVLREDELATAPGGSPHYIGVLETLALGRALELPLAERVTFLSVEASDCFTVGGGIHPSVRASIPAVVKQVHDILALAASSGARRRPAPLGL